MAQEQEWIECVKELPPVDELVATKIDDEWHGARNEQNMRFNKNLWWTGSGEDADYVYYYPTHWRRLSNEEAHRQIIAEIEKKTRRETELTRELDELHQRAAEIEKAK